MIPPFPRRALARALLVVLVFCAGCASREVLPPPLSDRSISRADEEAAEATFREGLDLVQLGRDADALQRFREVVERYPASRFSGQALYWQGRTQYQTGSDSAAARTMQRYLALSRNVPERDPALLVLANARYGLGDFQGALDAELMVEGQPTRDLDEFLSLSRDLMAHLPRPVVESTAAREPPRAYLAPFYLQAARWARAAGDARAASAMAERMTRFAELPSALRSEAQGLAGGTTRPASADRLGYIAPSEGRFAAVAEEIKRGIEIALADIDRTRGKPLELVSRSTLSDPDSTIGVIRELARGERVEAILGPLTSEFALPAARTASEEGIPMVSPTATDARILDVGPGVYTVNALDGAIGHTMGNYAVRNLGLRRPAILAVDNAYGRVQASAFEAAVQSAGGRITLRRDYPEGTTQFTEDLGDIMRTGADAVFIATKNPQEALRVVNQIAFYELKGLTPLGTDAWNDESFLREGRGFARGYFADTFSRDPRVTTWQDFAQRYQTKYGTAPTNVIPAWGYDAARLAVERLSATARAASVGSAASQPYHGASALFRFEPDGRIHRAVVVHKIERGQAVAVDW